MTTQLREDVTHAALPALIYGWLAAAFAGCILWTGEHLDGWDIGLLAAMLLLPILATVIAAHRTFRSLRDHERWRRR